MNDLRHLRAATGPTLGNEYDKPFCEYADVTCKDTGDCGCLNVKIADLELFFFLN